MKTSIINTTSVNSQILTSIVKRLSEADIYPDDALDELVNVDPDTELGKAMTTMMTFVSSLGLFDFYKGYTRSEDGKELKSFFSNDANPESMEKLVSKIESDIEGPVIDQPDSEVPVIKARLLKTTTGSDFEWAVELRIFSQKPDEDNVPVDIEMDGKVEVGGEAPGVNKDLPEVEEV